MNSVKDLHSSFWMEEDEWDDDFLVDLGLVGNEFLDLLDHLGSRLLDLVDDPFGFLLDLDRFEVLLLFRIFDGLGRRFYFGLLWLFAFWWKAGGHVFGACDFVFTAGVEHLFLRGFFTGGEGSGILCLTAGFGAVVAVSTTTASATSAAAFAAAGGWFEPLRSLAVAELSFTHG